jgi:glycosyltransferase involved in cell wall biosynthesis
MKIAIVVQGRFHAFDLARELAGRGHEVTLFTNYPRWAVGSFDLPGVRVRSFWVHGLLSRANDKLPSSALATAREAALHRLFGRWASAQLSKEHWDVVHIWSGVAEEALRMLARRPSTTALLMRGSAHIRTQARLLREEEARTGVPQDCPSDWMIAREEREYALADGVVVLSTFARDSFIDEGVTEDRLRISPLGASLSTFRPSKTVIDERRQRILSGAPLRVLYVGALSFRKGLWDLATVARRMQGSGIQFQLVGPRSPEVGPLLADLQGQVTVTPKRPQATLPGVYAWADLFIFPTLEDGYAMVLAQAAASALPTLTTTNCSGPDLIREGETGWVVPIRSPELLIERLQWCDTHRPELADMVDRLYTRFQPRDWAAAAADFEALCATFERPGTPANGATLRQRPDAAAFGPIVLREAEPHDALARRAGGKGRHMKIALVVHGRFHAFDLARALLGRGHEVTLFTNYPRWAVEGFDVPGQNVQGFWLHGLLTRLNERLPSRPFAEARQAFLHRMFGRWAQTRLAKESWDLVYLWSGVAEETLRWLPRNSSTLRLLVRGSGHIRTQDRMLGEEEARTGARQDRPSRWMIGREEREYALADAIVVLSTFAYKTFVAEGVPPERLRLLSLGTRLSMFRPSPLVVEARRQRILSGAPLHVLYVGALSFRKGLWDLSAAVRELSGPTMQFRLVGPQLREARPVLASLRGLASVFRKQPQALLPEIYAWGDVFVFPTIEDGFAIVLAQANAAALPIITTPNCSGPDLVRKDETGWIVPIRSPESLIERLRWCNTHRQEMAAMVDRLYTEFRPRTWGEVVADFEQLCAGLLRPVTPATPEPPLPTPVQQVVHV